MPAGVTVHFANVAESERAWSSSVPITAPARTLNDCAAANLSPELLRDAALDALHRGLVTRGELGAVEAALQPFGGLGS